MSRRSSTVSDEYRSIGTPVALSRISTLPGGRSDWSQLVTGTDSELTTTTTIRLASSRGVLMPRIRAASNSSSTSSTAHAEVVGEAAVDQVQEGTVLRVLERRHLLHALDRARGGPRRVVGIGARDEPGRKLVAAGAAVVVERDRRQHQRHRRSEYVAAARDRRTVDRSLHMTSKNGCANPTREPVEMSVAITAMNGPSPLMRSAYVALSNRISS